ncbi:hypothetical protein [Sphingobium sp. CFD-2]|uniref:hypothetical protein n=1 Tax=Sphingobium sp. CFD-2 TaxID=2878542 RepID=UPI00214C0AD3|nr:hypothetical protein [Sphingobium sp. CFD-2]
MSDSAVPTLEVGFAIDFSDSFGQLNSLDDLIGTASANAVREFQKMEAATKGVVNLGGATAQVTTFGAAASRELANVARDTNRAERAGEAMVRQIERQIETFGKSAAELRQMRAEMRAAEADSRGLTELASRLRAASAEMDRLEMSSSNFAVTGNRSRGVVAQLIPQFNDLGVQFAMAAQSSEPLKMVMMAIIQQGSQIMQVGQQAGVGLGGMAKQTVAATGALLLANPAILATAAAIGVASAAIGFMTSEINKNSSVTVTWQDTALGAWDAAKAYLSGQLTPAFTFFGTTAEEVWKQVVNATKWAVNWMIGVATLPARNLLAAFNTLPAGIGDAFYSSVNIAIKAINWLVEKGVGAINSFSQTVNLILPAALQIPTISAPKIKEVENAYAGAGAKAGKALLNSITDTVTRDFISEGVGLIRESAIARAKARAEEDGKKVGKAAAKGIKDGLADDGVAEAMADAIATAQGNVYRLVQEMVQRQQDWGKGQLTWGQQDIAARDDADKLKDAGVENARIALDAFMADLDKVSDRVDALAARMRNAFGSVGGAIGDMITILDEYGKRQAEIDEERLLGGADAKRLGELRKQEASNQLSGMIALTGAAKGLFNEHSKGYKAMAAAEKALTIIQLARTAVDVAGGAARMFAELGPWAFPAVAAMLGVMASLGFGGGGSSKPPPTNTGTGTVLGDSSAKSESIKRAIDALKEVDTVTSVYTREMAASLRSIESQIGGFATLLVRQADSINASDGVNTGFKMDTTGKVLSGLITGGGILTKIPILGSILGAIGGVVGSLFGTKTTIEGTGLYGRAQSLDDILSGGFDASYYTDIKKKKKAFGISYSTKYSTKYTEADAALENQFTLILRQFNDAIVAAAGPLSQATRDIQNRLNGFVVDLGKINLKGLTGEEIEEKLNAVFGAAADKMATTAFPGLERFQQVGEGMFETLVRVASTVDAVTTSLDMLGTSASGLTVDMKMALSGQFDSVSDFTNAVGSYFESFYTKEEQAAARTAQFADVFASLGLTMPTTLAAFRSLVDAQDLTTAAGQATYATLLQLAPAFADLQAVMNGAKSAADIASERQDLQRRLLELKGDTAALRALDLANLDASNREIQNRIWALQDAKEAADAADQLRQAWVSVGDGIMDEVKRIRGITDGSGAGGFATLLGEFNAATTAARNGDQDAAGKLVSLSQALLNAASLSATSKQELDRVKAQTAASLEQTNAIIMALGGVAASTGSGSTSAATLESAATAQAATPTATNDNMAVELRALREEVAQMRADNNAGHAANASNTGAIKRKLNDVTAASGGEAISVVGAAA